MKRILTFIAGLVSGVGLVLWWGGRKKNRYPKTINDVGRIMCKDGVITVTSRWRDESSITAVRKIVSDVVEDIAVRAMAMEFSLADTQPIRTQQDN